MKNQIIISVSLTVFFTFFCTVTEASIFSQLMKKAARVSDDVPLRAADDVIDPSFSKKLAGEVLDDSRHLDETAYSKSLIQGIEKSLGKEIAPETAQMLRTMDRPTLETSLMLCRGAENVSEAIPDIARRADFLKKADGNTLCVLGRYDDLIPDAQLFDKAANAKRIVSPPGMKSVTLDDFGTFFKKTGDAGYAFWTRSVKPHWKLWLGGTALAAILLAPEEYLDEFGNLTKEGFQKVITFGGETLGNALQGTIEGVAQAAETVVVKSAQAFWQSITGIIILLALVLTGIWLLWHRWSRIWKFLFKRRQSSKMSE